MPFSKFNANVEFDDKKWIVTLVNSERGGTAKKIFGHAVIVVEGMLENGLSFIGEYDITAQAFPEEYSACQQSLGNTMGYITKIRCNPLTQKRLKMNKPLDVALKDCLTIASDNSQNHHVVSEYNLYFASSRSEINPEEIDGKAVIVAGEEKMGLSLLLMQDELPDPENIDLEVPTLIKLQTNVSDRNEFYIYSILNGKPQFTKLENVNALEILDFNEKQIFVSPLENTEIYQEILSKNGHTPRGSSKLAYLIENKEFVKYGQHILTINLALSEEELTHFDLMGHTLNLIALEGKEPPDEDSLKSLAMPTLIKFTNEDEILFYFYAGFGAKAKFKRLTDIEELKKLDFSKKAIFVSPIKNAKIYQEITSKKLEKELHNVDKIEPIIQRAVFKAAYIPDSYFLVKKVLHEYPLSLHDESITINNPRNFDFEEEWNLFYIDNERRNKLIEISKVEELQEALNKLPKNVPPEKLSVAEKAAIEEILFTKNNLLVKTYRDYDVKDFSFASWCTTPYAARKMIESIEADALKLDSEIKNAVEEGRKINWLFKYQKAGINRSSFFGGNGGHNCITWAEEKLAIAGAGNGVLPTDSSKASTELHITCSIC